MNEISVSVCFKFALHINKHLIISDLLSNLLLFSNCKKRHKVHYTKTPEVYLFGISLGKSCSSQKITYTDLRIHCSLLIIVCSGSFHPILRRTMQNRSSVKGMPYRIPSSSCSAEHFEARMRYRNSLPLFLNLVN